MALGLRTSRADLLPLGDDLLWAAVCEPWCSQPALEGPAVWGGGASRNSEASRGTSAFPPTQSGPAERQ